MKGLAFRSEFGNCEKHLGIILDNASEFLQNPKRPLKSVALEDEIIVSGDDKVASLPGKELTQPCAVVQANQLVRDLEAAGDMKQSWVPWLEIMGPTLILYFVSKLLRVNHVLQRLPDEVCWRVCSTNGIVNAMARHVLPGKVRTRRLFLSKSVLKGFLSCQFPGMMSWQRILRISRQGDRRHYNTESKKRGVLLWCTNPVHEATAFEISQLLAAEGIPVSCITSRNTEWPFITPESAIRNREWKKKVKRSLPGLRIFIDEFSQSVIKSLAPKTKPLNCMRMSRFLMGQLDRFFVPQVADALALAQAAINRNEPRAVFIQDVGDFRTRAVACVARKQKIPVYHHQMGNVTSNAIEWAWDVADRHLVWGEWSKSTVVALGIPANKIDISGTPKINFPAKQPAPKTRSSSEVGHALFPLMPESSLNFGNGGATSLSGCQSIMKMLLECVKLMAGRVVLQIKPRPLGDHPWFDLFRSTLSSQVEILPAHISIGQALESTDIVITTHSTVGIDAIMLGKPLIVLSGGHEIHPFEELIQYGAAVKTDSVAELKATTENLLFNAASSVKMMQCQEACRKHILRYAGADSTQRIVDLLKN